MDFPLYPDRDTALPDRRRVLILEDNEPLREILATLLEPTYDVSTADDGEAGLTVFHQTGPDIVILDMMMPEADGRFFILCLFAQGIPVPVIAMSSDVSLLSDARRLGVADTLRKPFNIGELEAKIDLLLGPPQA
ncbi:MAG: response regulator [Acidobacteriota bacterium]